MTSSNLGMRRCVPNGCSHVRSAYRPDLRRRAVGCISAAPGTTCGAGRVTGSGAHFDSLRGRRRSGYLHLAAGTTATHSRTRILMKQSTVKTLGAAALGAAIAASAAGAATAANLEGLQSTAGDVVR